MMMHIRMMVLWDVVPCSVVNSRNIWEKSALFFFYPEDGGWSSLKHCYGKLDCLTLKTKVLWSLEALGITQCHIPACLNLHQHDCDYLRSCTGAAPLNQNTWHRVPEGFLILILIIVVEIHFQGSVKSLWFLCGIFLLCTVKVGC